MRCSARRSDHGERHFLPNNGIEIDASSTMTAAMACSVSRNARSAWYARGDAFNTATNLEANGSKPTGRWQRVVRRPRRAPTLQRSGRIAVPEDRFRGDRKSLAFRSFRQSDPSGGRSPEQPAAAEGSRICCFSFELLSYKASIDLPIPPNRHPSEGVVGYREYRAYAMSPKRPRFVAAKKQSGHGRSR
jgi:hypothetical protein